MMARAWRSSSALLLFSLGVFGLGALISCGGGGDGGSNLASGGSTGGSGGTGGGGTPTNVVSVVADGGPTQTQGTVNTLYTSVTVCVPGSSTSCQTIDHIQVDTGSSGLRILASALTLSLPAQTAQDGNSLLECIAFVDGYSWGPVVSADMKIAGESAASLPVQVIGDSRFPNVPANCSSTGPAEDTVATFGANGILGISVFAQDCGAGCAGNVDNGVYYSCTQTVCNATAATLAQQVPNPVTFFATDNNGTILDLPSVAAQGAATVTGSLIFGIDTQSNNASGTQTVLTVDPDYGYIGTLFNNQTFDQSFIDSGSNALYFTDDDLQACTDSNFTGFYCPDSTANLTGTLQGQNGMSATASFSVANAQTVLDASPSFTVFPTLGGTNSNPQSFDWGLPFFFGRRVANALENVTTSAGMGPYVAF